MLIAYWIVAALTALACLGAGGLKLIRPYDQLRGAMGWVNDFRPWQVKLIGAVEVLGAIGLILPMATGILPVLSPIAGIGSAIIQAGAFVTHARRGNEQQMMIANMVVFALAGASAVLGFFALS